MTQKVCLAVFALLISFNTMAQENLNKYKYILVPKQYEFQKNPDSYQINSLHKFLFDKAGFETLFTDEEYPADLVEERCMALTSKVTSNPSMFKTRFTVELYDCYNKLVYKSPLGTSKIKEYKKAYNETLRRAMAELIEKGHTYDPGASATSEVTAKETPEKAAETAAVITASKIVPAEKVTEEVQEVAQEEVAPVAEKETVAVKEVAVQEAKEVASETTKEVSKVAVPAVAVVAVSTEKKEVAKVAEVKTPSIEGTYNIDMWGLCKVVKKGDGYAVIGGDEDFEFATISPTSNPSMFMLKKTGFKQVQLLELDAEGTIRIDTANGFKTYKKEN